MPSTNAAVFFGGKVDTKGGLFTGGFVEEGGQKIKYGVQNVFDQIDSSKAREQQVATVEQFLQRFGGIELNKTSTLGSQQNKIKRGLMNIDKASAKKMYQSKDPFQKVVGAAALELQTKGGDLNSEQMQNVVDAIVLGNIDGTTSRMGGAGKINKGLIAADQIKPLQSIDQNQAKTAAALKQIVEELKVIKENQ